VLVGQLGLIDRAISF